MKLKSAKRRISRSLLVDLHAHDPWQLGIMEQGDLKASVDFQLILMKNLLMNITHSSNYILCISVQKNNLSISNTRTDNFL